MEKLRAKVTRKIQETPDVVTIYFTVAGQVFDYVAGQYVTVYFEDTDVKTGKAYSLSSAPKDSQMSITVKNIGLFSGKLHALELGDELLVSRPYGFFNVKDNKPIVAITSGVGISPVWSIICDSKPKGRKIELFYSNKTKKDIVFKKQIDKLVGAGKLDVTYFTTQDSDSEYTCRRIDISKDIEISDGLNFYICGSQGFVTSMWQQLIRAGASEASISTETFFENQ